MFLLFYISSAVGLKPTFIPWLATSETGHSLVVSFRGINQFEWLNLDQSFYASRDVYYRKSEGGEIVYGPKSEFFNFLYSQSSDELKKFWEDKENGDNSVFRSLVVAEKEIEDIRLNRILALIHFPAEMIEESDDESDDDLNAYLSAVAEGLKDAEATLERASVGGDEIIADYLLTRFLTNEIELEAPDTEFGRSSKTSDQNCERSIGVSDFSYHSTLAHLNPIFYEEIDMDYGQTYYKETRTDEFYYRFDHKRIESIQQQLSIPDEIVKILTEEIWVQLPQIFIKKIMKEVGDIKHEVFGMDPPPKKSRRFGAESLQDYLGFDGPFSDSEMGD